MIARAGEELQGSAGCLPNSGQRELLRAACCPPETAAPAWKRWRSNHDLNQLDPVSTRLMVWIFHRRDELGLVPEEVACLEPIYRFAWMTNQRILNSAQRLARVFEAEKIEFLFLKGLPLLLELYGEESARFLEDFDLLIRCGDAERVLDVMHNLGYRLDIPNSFSTRFFKVRHSSEFVQPDGPSCDIHWRLLRPPNPAVDEEPLWASKRPLKLRDLTVFAPSVELALLHLMVHGMAWERVPPVRWILDAHLLLKRHAPDWDSLLEEARRREVLLPISEALSVYEEILPGEISAWVRAEAARHSPSARQRRAYEQIALPYEEVSLRVAWEIYRSDYQMERALGNAAAGPKGALEHLCRYLRVPSPAQLPGKLLARVLKRTRL
jgi:hypothetical protein